MEPTGNYTQYLPSEIVMDIMYKHKGLTHPIASMMHDYIDEYWEEYETAWCDDFPEACSYIWFERIGCAWGLTLYNKQTMATSTVYQPNGIGTAWF